MISENKIKNSKVYKYAKSEVSEVEDKIVVERPLEIRLSSGSVTNRVTEPIYITMRTPGEDIYLALGFLFTENIIQSIDHVFSVASLNENVILVELKPDFSYDNILHQRNFSSTSSCGICGKTSISSIHNHRYPKINHKVQVSASTILSLPQIVKDKELIFNLTGGLHSASLMSLEGELIAIFEDVGRHNALDKLVGYMLKNKIDNRVDYLFLLSGRLGFELIHKTLKIGVSILVAIGSPSDLSVKIAKQNGLCMIGFLKENGFNVYSGEGRVLPMGPNG